MATFQETYGLTVTINGKTYEDSGTKDITGVTKAYQGVLSAADATYANLCTISATAGASTLATLKKAQIVNNETTEGGTTARIKFTDTGADEYIRELKAGQSMFIDSAGLEVSASGAGFSAMATLDTISVAGDGAAVSISYVFAGT